MDAQIAMAMAEMNFDVAPVGSGHRDGSVVQAQRNVDGGALDPRVANAPSFPGERSGLDSNGC